MIIFPDGQLLAAVRIYETDDWHPARTVLCRIDPHLGKLIKVLALPSGGDTSYAGLAWYNEILWVSYYSSH